jgi:stage II sporulation protein D
VRPRMRRPAALCALAVTALAAALGAAAAASAQPGGERATTTVFTFQGRGWGHGVGMSQYGARGQALAGRDAGQILRHYYQGTRLAAAPTRAVRVLLSDGRRRAAFSSGRPWVALGRATDGRARVRLRAGAVHTLRAGADGRLVLVRGARRVALFAGAVRLAPAGRGGSVAWGGTRPDPERRYRGQLRAVPSRGGFDLLNVVGLEDYLRGVVPREMPADWGDDAPAALQVQAVAARSYATATLKPDERYDIFDDDRSQTYGGVASEDPRSDRAVRSTRNTVLTYDGRVITTYFFSSSGGRTENVENVFRDSPPRPYLTGVPDPWDKGSPYHDSWPDPPSFTGAGLGRALGLDGPVRTVEILSRGTSGRAKDVRFTTKSGQRSVRRGIELRSTLGLRDSWFRVTERKMTPAAAARLVGGG